MNARAVNFLCATYDSTISYDTILLHLSKEVVLLNHIKTVMTFVVVEGNRAHTLNIKLYQAFKSASTAFWY